MPKNAALFDAIVAAIVNQRGTRDLREAVTFADLQELVRDIKPLFADENGQV